jgi:hypothetical protein
MPTFQLSLVGHSEFKKKKKRKRKKERWKKVKKEGRKADSE